MKRREIIHPDKADKSFSTGAYSAGLIIDEEWLYISGQGPINFKISKFELGTIEEETHLTMYNIKRLCEAAGCSMDDIVKCTIHLSDIKDFDKFNAIYASYFKGIKPSRTTVQSVLGNGIKVEIDAIVRMPEATK